MVFMSKKLVGILQIPCLMRHPEDYILVNGEKYTHFIPEPLPMPTSQVLNPPVKAGDIVMITRTSDVLDNLYNRPMSFYYEVVRKISKIKITLRYDSYVTYRFGVLVYHAEGKHSGNWEMRNWYKLVPVG